MSTRNPGRFALLILFALLVLGIGAVILKSVSEPTTAGRKGPRTIPVAVATVSERLFTEEIEALGTARADESVQISAKVTDTVSKVHFEDGILVEAGTILVELTNAEESAELASAEAALVEARKAYSRADDLLKKGTGTKARFDQAQAALRSARARKGAIEARLADRLIKAPFEGVVGLRNVSQGSLVRPGDPITTLDDVSVIKLDFTVPETYLGAIKVGQEIVARTDAFPDNSFKGKISAIATRVDPATRSATVRALVPNDDLLLRPGMLLRVRVIRTQEMVLSVPERALLARSEEVYVYRVSDEKAERVGVTIGRRNPPNVEVRSGLNVGDEIIVDGVHRVQPNSSVTIKERDGMPVATAPVPAKSGS